ncbi:MAG TPA: cytochrome c3 family protein, partial [Edaphobacter sp.]
ARMSLVLTGLIVIALGVALDQLQRSPWVTKQGQRPDQPIPFSHKHHVEGLGLQCQYCHTQVEKAAYAGIPPTKTCINCHAQIWTNSELLEPVRQSWATGESVRWIRVHDLPDFVYFSHDVHVNKGIGCASCHGRVDEMPLMYQQNTLQMEWCLNCHRNPAVNLRPTSEIYNMAWAGPSTDKPVWCASTGKGGATAQSVSCTTIDPTGKGGPELAQLEAPTPAGQAKPQSGTNLQPHPLTGEGQTVSDVPPMILPASYVKFTSQIDLGKYLTAQYHIRTPEQLQSCETCHR